MTMKGLLKGYVRYLYANVTKGYTDAMLKFLEPCQDAVLIDAGCWDGANTMMFGNRVGTKKLIGLEFVPEAVAKACKKGITAHVADLNKKMPMADESVDVAVSNHVIEHLYSPNTFVEELYRILKPGGYAVIGTPNLASWHNIFALANGRQPYSGPTVKLPVQDMAEELRSEKVSRLTEDIGDKNRVEDAYGHIVVLTYKTLIRLLKAHGFRIEKTAGFGYHPFPPVFARFLSQFDKSHCHYMLVKARKPATKQSMK
jgi:SAM-dependent methyltransferase